MTIVDRAERLVSEINLMRFEDLRNDVTALVVKGANDALDKRIGAQLFGSPAGKSRIANRLLVLFPEHKTYVEAFVGGGALFWGKEPSDREALNDFNPDIAGAYKFIRDISDGEISTLKRMNWKVSKEHHQALQKSKPKTPAAAFHRMAMLRYAGFMRNPDGGMDNGKIGATLDLFDRIPKAKERLKGVSVKNGDYRAIMRANDGPDSFHFLDPPYTKTDQNVGESGFDHREFWTFLATLKGKFMVTYDAPDPDNKFKVQILEHKVTDGSGGSNRVYKTYVITNYEAKRIEPPAEKKDEGERVVAKFIPVDKAEAEQIVFGVVLEPNETDAQGDTISEEEIYDTAHEWLAKFQNRGLMHQELINDKARIFESYIAPANLTIGGQQVKKGTWLLMYHVKDAAIWEQIKRGELTGFSMGGFARRVNLRNGNKSG